jgi:beta-lactamase superfamily II metal-dependent hydrolase
MFRVIMFPACEGDCFLVETGDRSSPYRVLIDGGRTSTARDHLIPFLRSLPARAGPLINLMIVTHIDADHIEGILTMIEDGPAPTVGEIWFNDLRHLEIAAGEKPSKRPPALVERADAEVTLSIKQGIALGRHIPALGWAWNRSFNGGPVMVDLKQDPQPIRLTVDTSLLLLAPYPRKLARLREQWKAISDELGDTEHTLADRSKSIPSVENIGALAATPDKPDTAVPNGTSIAFVLCHQGRRVLFGADAQPDDLVESLSHHFREVPIRFDAIKVPHHGSAANNTNRLIRLLEAPQWLISTDGSGRSAHPDAEAVARIVLGASPGKRLIFNYASRQSICWAKPELVAKCNFVPVFPDEEGRATEVMLIS